MNSHICLRDIIEMLENENPTKKVTIKSRGSIMNFETVENFEILPEIPDETNAVYFVVGFWADSYLRVKDRLNISVEATGNSFEFFRAGFLLCKGITQTVVCSYPLYNLLYYRIDIEDVEQPN